jgi:hypothetical protein
VIHGYMETWVPGYLLDRRDRFASRAHLVHLRPFSNGSATSPRPGFRKLFLPPTLGQHRYRQSQPVRSIRSQGRLATRELVHSHKAHSRYCHQHQTLTDQRGEPGGHLLIIQASASFRKHIPNPVLCLFHTRQPCNISEFGSLLSFVPFNRPSKHITANPLLRRIACITSQTNPQNPPGTSQASSRPACGHLHISGRHTSPSPVRLPPPATKNPP